MLRPSSSAPGLPGGLASLRAAPSGSFSGSLALRTRPRSVAEGSESPRPGSGAPGLAKSAASASRTSCWSRGSE
eukprot:5861876-Lingulodinium_polyedra.AAC.1